MGVAERAVTIKYAWCRDAEKSDAEFLSKCVPGQISLALS